MRTTITLDDDVASHLELLRQKKKVSMKNLINQSLRLGLHALEQEATDRKIYRIQSKQLGKKRPDLDNIAEILATDDEAWR